MEAEVETTPRGLPAGRLSTERGSLAAVAASMGRRFGPLGCGVALGAVGLGLSLSLALAFALALALALALAPVAGASAREFRGPDATVDAQDAQGRAVANERLEAPTPRG